MKKTNPAPQLSATKTKMPYETDAQLRKEFHTDITIKNKLAC